MYCIICFKIILLLLWRQEANCMNIEYSFDGDIAQQLLNNKEFIPDDKDLPKPSIIKTRGNDASDSTYILSKLSDDELLKLLDEFPKRFEYNMDDIIKVSGDLNDKRNELGNNKKDISAQDEHRSAVFRLENKEVDPYSINKDGDQNYNALQKLNNMLYSRPQEDISTESDDKKEILFNILVAQLKTLCCKKNKSKNFRNKVTTKTSKPTKQPTEYIFLVVNDEIKSNASDELIRVDPDSLSKNSSVLLLGPITTPLSDVQTMLVISRISNELSKPEYLPLLNKISEGNLGKKNSELLKSLISGPETRRYIKPHRCNHQSKLSKIYGGPKWIICTGYLNLNTPSLYD